MQNARSQHSRGTWSAVKPDEVSPQGDAQMRNTNSSNYPLVLKVW